MIGFSVKRVIKKLQDKIHEDLQCKLRTIKNLVKNTLIGFSGKNVLKKISGKCMKSTNIRNFHFQCKKRSGIRSLPMSAKQNQYNAVACFFLSRETRLLTYVCSLLIHAIRRENRIPPSTLSTFCSPSAVSVGWARERGT